MSTTGNYEFTKNGVTRSFYCHHDNYPTGARERLSRGIKNGKFDIEAFIKENKAEENANCSANYTYKVNLENNEVTIVKEHFKNLGGGYNDEYVTFNVEYQQWLYSFTDSTTNDNSFFEPMNDDYQKALQYAMSVSNARKARHEESENRKEEAVRKERLQRAYDMNKKVEQVEFDHGGEKVTCYVAKNCYVIIETDKKTVVRFIGDGVFGGYSYRAQYGDMLSCSSKTCLVEGTGSYGKDSRLTLGEFVCHEKNKVRYSRQETC